jgi:hypothetical protein
MWQYSLVVQGVQLLWLVRQQQQQQSTVTW